MRSRSKLLGFLPSLPESTWGCHQPALWRVSTHAQRQLRRIELRALNQEDGLNFSAVLAACRPMR